MRFINIEDYIREYEAHLPKEMVQRARAILTIVERFEHSPNWSELSKHFDQVLADFANENALELGVDEIAENQAITRTGQILSKQEIADIEVFNRELQALLTQSEGVASGEIPLENTGNES